MNRALVIGASGGIGSAMVMALGNRLGMGNVVTGSRSADGLDICDEDSVSGFAAGLEGDFDLILVATGALQIGDAGPEKTIRKLSPAAMQAQFITNAIGPALLLKHLHPFLPKQGRAVFATLTARVGSIGDNNLGGWISYRAAKAAANQIIRTAAIEIALKRPEAICVALHPGTVQTELTEGFGIGASKIPPDEAAQNLLKVIEKLNSKDTGQFFDWKGAPIPW